MGLGELSPWHLLILAAVVLVLFGAKRLPDSARSLGKAMRIFKTETQALREENENHKEREAVSAAPQHTLPSQAPVTAPPGQESAPAPAPVPDAQRTNSAG